MNAMNTILQPPTYTPDELLALPDSKRYELVDGHLVEKHVGALSSLVEGLVFERVQQASRQHRQGWVWPSSMGYQCFPAEPNKVRRPDVSFIRAERFRPEMLEAGFLTLAPDLAVEVLSPNDLACEVTEKVEAYLSAGVVLVWVVDPASRLVDVYRQNGTSARLRTADELTGEAVIAEFRCRVSELFPS